MRPEEQKTSYIDHCMRVLYRYIFTGERSGSPGR